MCLALSIVELQHTKKASYTLSFEPNEYKDKLFIIVKATKMDESQIDVNNSQTEVETIAPVAHRVFHSKADIGSEDAWALAVRHSETRQCKGDRPNLKRGHQAVEQMIVFNPKTIAIEPTFIKVTRAISGQQSSMTPEYEEDVTQLRSDAGVNGES